jgi:hypothetical protein
VDTPTESLLPERKEIGRQNTGKEVIQDNSWDRVRDEYKTTSRRNEVIREKEEPNMEITTLDLRPEETQIY